MSLETYQMEYTAENGERKTEYLTSYVYEAMDPEEMFLYDEAFGRHSTHDSIANFPVCSITGAKEVMLGVQRSISRHTERPELTIVQAMKEYIEHNNRIMVKE